MRIEVVAAGAIVQGRIAGSPPQRVTVAPQDKLLVSREEAAQLLSISERGLDYLAASKRLPTQRIGGRVLIPVADLRKYARCDHPERIMS